MENARKILIILLAVFLAGPAWAADLTVQPCDADVGLQPTNDYTATTMEAYTYNFDHYNNVQSTVILKFDFSSLPDTATISSATLSLYADSVPGYNGSLLARRLIQTAWVESEATKFIYSTGNNWIEYFGDYTTDNQAYETLYGTGWKDFTVTGIVQYARENTSEVVHFWIGVTTVQYDQSGRVIFRSSEHVTSSTHPKLTITYSNGYSQTVSGVASPASVNGVAGASISKVLGVE